MKMECFVKAGMAFADVETTESLSTGDTYGDASTEGLMAGIGMSRDLDNGMFVRGELSYVDYDDISITSTGGSTVKADVDSTNVTFSIGKSF